MALLVRKGFALYRHLFDEMSDPRTSNWFLCGGLAPVALLLGSYLYFVLNLGPRLMQHRKPFNLDKIMIVYNAVQVVACMHVVREAIWMYFYNDYSFFCQPVDYSTSDSAMRAAAGFWFYYMLKVADLLDTIFFVLRKKQRQISFLHVYHHTGMILIGYFSTKFLAGGHGAFIGLANSVVHVVLYTHYLLSILNPEYGRNGWYKKYITQMQLVQFAMIVVHFGQLIFMPACKYPKFTVGVVVPQNLFLALLFFDFYRRTYSTKKPAVSTTAAAATAAPTSDKTDSRQLPAAAAAVPATEAVTAGSSGADRRAS